MFSACLETNLGRLRSLKFDKVKKAIEESSIGDTIILPKGKETYENPLFIGKGITLKGSGIDKTILKCDFTSQGNGVITYSASSPNDFFRLSKLTLDGNNMCNGLMLRNSNGTNYIENLRVDHIKVKNAGGVNAGRSICISGNIFGVIDHNIIENCYIGSYARNAEPWESLPQELGTKLCIYYEDNLFISTSSTYHASGHGGRYCTRYNKYSRSEDYQGSLYPLMDMHGNLPGNLYSTMIGEVYGNLIQMEDSFGGLIDQRGGKAVVFWNKVYTTSTNTDAISQKVRQEYDDEIEDSRFIQKVTSSYYWNNRYGKEGEIFFPVHESMDCCDDIAENVDYFNQNFNFDGSEGIGCGILSDRPSTCSVGVAFFETDLECENIFDENIGPKPKNGPLSGTLWKCVATNTWEKFYEPFVYPHPLVNDEKDYLTFIIVSTVGFSLGLGFR